MDVIDSNRDLFTVRRLGDSRRKILWRKAYIYTHTVHEKSVIEGSVKESVEKTNEKTEACDQYPCHVETEYYNTKCSEIEGRIKESAKHVV